MQWVNYYEMPKSWVDKNEKLTFYIKHLKLEFKKNVYCIIFMNTQR